MNSFTVIAAAENDKKGGGVIKIPCVSENCVGRCE